MSKWCLCVWALPVFIPWLNIFFAAQLGELLKVASGGAWEPNWAHERLLAMEEFFRVMNKPLAWVLFLAVSFFNYLWSQIKTVVMAGLLLWYRNLHVLVKGIYFPRISLRFFFFFHWVLSSKSTYISNRFFLWSSLDFLVWEPGTAINQERGDNSTYKIFSSWT